MRTTTKTLALTCSAAVLAGAAQPPAAAGRDARVSLLTCHRALRPADRYLAVEGAMHAAAPGERLEMRFALLRRSGSRPEVSVPGPGLGVFNRAATGVGNYRFRKMIRNLTTAGEYRVAVTFRWRRADGAVLATAVRSSSACLQTDTRADLRIEAIEVAGGTGPSEAIYAVTVRNVGGRTASSFRVALSYARGTPPRTGDVARLAPGRNHRLSFTAPRCAAGEPLVAIVDPERRVQESSDANNTRGLPCPAATLSRR